MKRSTLAVATTSTLIAGIAGVSASPLLSNKVSIADAPLAESSIPSVVRIVGGCQGTFYWPDNQKTYEASALGSGSGYFVNADGYIVTNAHVTELSENADACKKALFQQFVTKLAQDYNVEPQAALNNAEVLTKIASYTKLTKFQSVHQVLLSKDKSLPYEVKVSGKPVGEGKDVAIIKIEVKNAPVLKLADSDEIQLQDHVTAIGYPASGDSKILNRDALVEPSVTDGKVSARKELSDGSPVLQVSAPATHGSSGGPVLNDKGEVVGIVTFGGEDNGQLVSGFTFLVPANTIAEFVKQAGINNETGTIDQLYREGLVLYNQKKYQQALKKFETVKTLFPEHADVHHFIQNCTEKLQTSR